MKYEHKKRTSRVGERGQVTIPKTLRNRYGVEPGQEVEFEETDDGLVLRKVAKTDPLQDLLGRIRVKIDVDKYLEQSRGPGWSNELDGTR